MMPINTPQARMGAAMAPPQKDAERSYLVKILGGSPSFRGVSPEDLAELARPARTLAVQRGAVIAPPKGKAPEIYVLESGVVAKLAAELEGGKSVLVRVDAGRMGMAGNSHLVGYFDAPADKPTVIEFTAQFQDLLIELSNRLLWNQPDTGFRIRQ